MSPVAKSIPAISARALKVSPFLAMDVLARAAARERDGGDVVHMEVGQPSASAPRTALEAARAALDGRIGYTEALGIAPLRERIARHYRETYDVEVSPQRVVVTTGSSAGFVLAFLAMFEAGDRVAITAPGYPAYRNILEALDVAPHTIALARASGFVMTGEALAQAHAAAPLKGALAMSPANPSGTMMSEAVLAGVARVCRENGLWFVSDEIYHGLTYGEPAQTALRFDPEAVIVNSFSKYFCMTGWRVGWLVVPERLSRVVERLCQSLYISAPYLSQVAALAAFDGREELEAVKQGYARNRDMLLDELPRIGVGDLHPADGAFYVYADIARFTNDSVSFCARLLDEAGVAVTPGLDFDPIEGHHTMRLSFAGSFEACREGVRRIATFLR